MDKEDLETNELLTQTAFKKDPDKANRMEELKFAYPGIANAANPARESKGERTLRLHFQKQDIKSTPPYDR